MRLSLKRALLCLAAGLLLMAAIAGAEPEPTVAPVATAQVTATAEPAATPENIVASTPIGQSATIAPAPVEASTSLFVRWHDCIGRYHGMSCASVMIFKRNLPSPFTVTSPVVDSDFATSELGAL